MRVRYPIAAVAALMLIALVASPVARAQTSPPTTQKYGRSAIDLISARAQPGGVFAVTVRNGGWASANTLLDGRRATLTLEEGRLFGLIPVALDTQPADHRLSLFFPGGRSRGGVASLVATVTPAQRPARTRQLTPEAVAAASTQTALGHARFLLAAIRTREARALHSGPLRPPVDGPISFPFGGAEDFGVVMGPMKDGLIGEHHRGVDYDVPHGTVVRAPGNGVVLLARNFVFTGETVVIAHGRGLVSVLAHLDHVSVREGDLVNQGTAVGASGKSGLGAFTAHLCFSVYLHSLNIDPEAMMDASLFPAPATALKR